MMTEADFYNLTQRLERCEHFLRRIVWALERLSPPPEPVYGPTKPAGPEALTRLSLPDLAHRDRDEQIAAETQALDTRRSSTPK